MVSLDGFRILVILGIIVAVLCFINSIKYLYKESETLEKYIIYDNHCLFIFFYVWIITILIDILRGATFGSRISIWYTVGWYLIGFFCMWIKRKKDFSFRYLYVWPYEVVCFVKSKIKHD